MMRKRIVLGDVHGRFDKVKEIYDKERPDDVIILGDYLDTHENISSDQQRQSLKKLIELKDNHKNGMFVLLMGNHDFHYYYNYPFGEKYSGYNYDTARWACEYLRSLVRNKKIQIIYYEDLNKTIYSHAGVTNTWVSLHDIDCLQDINGRIDKDFGYGDNFIFTYGSRFSNYGESKENSCIWVRPYSLLNDLYKDGQYVQIVGHTCIANITGLKLNENKPVSINDANIILIDTMLNEYLVETLDDNGKLIKRTTKNR